MVRAAVLIGVAQAGILDTLQAVHQGVRAMEKWALAQGIERKMVKVFTDERGPVEVSKIKKAIKQLVDLSTVEQLIVYFAGHGVNISRGEVWLLSGAPEDPNEAVNVSGSIELARFCGIPHVVLISDACRTAAEGVQAQGVRGSEIFPNLDSGTENPVDVFFACRLGAPALEVKDPKQAAAGFRAIYTDSLVEALQGQKDVLVTDPEEPAPVRLIEVAAADGKSRGIIRPWPLSFHLQAEVLERLMAAEVEPGVSQMPHARINSRGTWLAEVPAPPAPPPPPSPRRASVPTPPSAGGVRPRKPARGAGGVSAPARPRPAARRTALDVSRALLKSTLEEDVPLSVGSAEVDAGAETSNLTESLSRIVKPFGPAHLDTRCGFKVRGDAVKSATTAPAGAEVSADRQVVAVDLRRMPAANVLIELESGSGMVLPAIGEYIAAVTIERGEVVNVTYSPDQDSDRWADLEGRADDLTALRALVASSTRLGVFQLRGKEAAELAQRMRVMKGFDPTLAIYSAYAYHDLQQTGRVRDIEHILEQDLNVRLFDLALLGGSLRGRSVTGERLHPFVPLLSQGWALMRAHRVELPPGLAGLEGHLVESLWTLFDAAGVDLIRTAILNKEVE